MTPEDISSLLDICDATTLDLERFDKGEDYKKLNIREKFNTIVSPLLIGSEIIPELRRSVAAVDLFNLKKCISVIRNAEVFSRGSSRQQYGGAISSIKNALENYKSTLHPYNTRREGPLIAFYSWQSTLPNKTNRAFIRESLEKAVKMINVEVSIDNSVRIDSDTSGRPGSPKIFDTILRKIEGCDVFIADVSIVSNGQSNSNVMVELGYALKAVGADRIIMVCNIAYGNVKELPFDLGFNRVIMYCCSVEKEDKASERATLAAKLKAAIEGVCRPTDST